MYIYMYMHIPTRIDTNERERERERQRERGSPFVIIRYRIFYGFSLHDVLHSLFTPLYPFKKYGWA